MEPKDELDISTAQNIKEPQVDEYRREDSDKGLVKDAAEISMLRASRKYDVFANYLLGDFDQEGRYKIPDYILTDLVHMPKTQVQKVEDGILLRAVYKDGSVFNFMLSTPVINNDGTATSILFLYETVKRTNGYIINTLTTTVGVYTYKNNALYTENAFRAFTVIDNKNDPDDPDESTALKPSPFIDARLNYLKVVAESSGEQYEQLEEKYFNRRLQILNELPEGALILSEFAKRRAFIEKYFLASKSGKFRALNDLLTSILELDTKSNIAANPNYKTMMGDLNNKYYALTLKIAENLNSQPKVQQAKQALDLLLVETPAVKIAGGIKLLGETPKHNKPKTAAAGAGKNGNNNGGSKKGEKSYGGKKEDKKDKKKEEKKAQYTGMPSVKSVAKTIVKSAEAKKLVESMPEKAQQQADSNSGIAIEKEFWANIYNEKLDKTKEEKKAEKAPNL